MGQVINTNILSLTAQRNLQSSQGELATSLQRLSSGLRINSAKDDAAGLAISERFTTQIRGLNQAIRNSNDGISLAQTGEAALATVTQNLQRIRELAVQSVNATNSDTDRATLQQEVSQRLNEIDRIAGQTSFNGRNVLDGSFGNALFQVGANVGETISLQLDSSVRTSDVGAVATATSVDLSTLIAEGSDAVTGVQAQATFDLSALLGTDYSTSAATNSTATVAETALQGDFSTTAAQAGSATLDFSGATIAANDSIDVNGVTFTFTDSTTVGATVGGATAVAVNVDFAGGATQQNAIDAFAAAIGTAAADGTVTAIDSEITAGGTGTTTITLTDSTAGSGTGLAAASVTSTFAGTDPVINITAETAAIDRSVEFTLTDGTNTDTFTLSTDLTGANAAALESAISSQLSAFGVSASGTDLVFTSTAAGATTSAPTLTAAQDPDNDGNNGPLNGSITVSADSAGQAAVPNSIDLVIGDPGDGAITVTLDADLSTGTTADQSTALLGAITSALDGTTPEFSASDDGAGNITLTDVGGENAGQTGTTGSFTLSSDGTPQTATSTTAGVSGAAAVAGATLTITDLTVSIGDADPLTIADGTYSSQDAFLNAVNTALGSNATATLDAATNTISITSGDDIAIGGTQATDVFASATNAASGNLGDTSVATVSDSNIAISRIDSALTSVSDLRSTFGAIQNRFESTIANLSTTTENLQASRSRILDADFAQETANLTRAQILQQAGISVLAQANVQPQSVLALLN